jgi:microcin C transport system permease protein
VHDGSRIDVISSTVILVGYAIPGFVLAILLIVLFGGGSFWNIFPLRGLVSDNWSELSLMSKILDYLWHMVADHLKRSRQSGSHDIAYQKQFY